MGKRNVHPLDREIAALMCSMMACGARHALYTEDVAPELDLYSHHPAAQLAHEAVCYVEHARRKGDIRGRGWHRENAAEAEAMLRTGWTP